MKSIGFVVNALSEGSGPLQRGMALAKVGYSVKFYIIFDKKSAANFDSGNRYQDYGNVSFQYIRAASYLDLKSILRLLDAVRKHKISTLFLHHGFSGLYLPILIITLPRTLKFVRVELTSMNRLPMIQVVLSCLSRVSSRLHTIFISKATQRTQLELCERFYNSRCSVVYNGISSEHFLLEGLEKPNANIDLIYAGRLIDLKNIDIAVTAAKKLITDGTAHKFHILGDGPSLSKLRKLVTDPAIQNRIIFEGYVDRSKVLDGYKRAAFGFFLSTTEGFSESLLQSMANGCIPIVSKIEPYKEALGSELFFALSADSDATSVVQRIENLLALQEDGLLLLRSKIVKRARLYEMSKIVERYEEFIR